MSESVLINAQARENSGKGAARRLRDEGRIPAVVYGGDGEPMIVSIDSSDFRKEYNQPGFFTRLYDLKINDDVCRVLPRDVQLHPVTEYPLHADFLRYVEGTKISVFVAVRFVGQEECEGLKRGGVINVVRHEVELLCPVDSIPDELIADISGLIIGDSVHISHIPVPDGVVPTISDRDFTVATIAAPTVSAEVDAVEGEDGVEDEAGDAEATEDEAKESTDGADS